MIRRRQTGDKPQITGFPTESPSSDETPKAKSIWSNTTSAALRRCMTVACVSFSIKSSSIGTPRAAKKSTARCSTCVDFIPRRVGDWHTRNGCPIRSRHWASVVSRNNGASNGTKFGSHSARPGANKSSMSGVETTTISCGRSTSYFSRYCAMRSRNSGCPWWCRTIAGGSAAWWRAASIRDNENGPSVAVSSANM